MDTLPEKLNLEFGTSIYESKFSSNVSKIVLMLILEQIRLNNYMRL